MRRIFTFFLTFLLGVFVTALYAQTHTVSGTVIDKDANEPLIGANVLIKGTTIGTVTDLDGKYTLQAGDKDILVFSYLSMKTIEEPVNGRTVINVKMASDTETLGEVVVTAMGIKRQSETLTYSAQTVGGKDVNDIKSVNMINSLQGKSAGMMITPNSTGAGGSSKILFRGNKSISGNNQPLVVVDGVPVMMNITNSQVDSNYGGQRDGGDAMSTINPDDIAQITLLKGASAAALYGAVAANGAIMITTKSAQSGKVSVNVSSNTTMESPMVLPEFQTTYGMSDNGTFSWGEKLSSKAPNYAKKFFRTGFTTNNSISLSGGNENIQSYFSYANVYSQGITPQNDYRSHNLNSKVGFNILKDIHIDFTAKFTNQHITNQAAAGYLWNPLTGVYLFPRGEDWNGYKENFEVYDPARGCYVQNWTNTQQQQFGNPYWMLNRQTPITDRNRYEFGGSIKWNITPDLNIQGRMRYERGEEHWVHNAYASSVGNLYPMGRMKDNRYFSDQLYGDVLVSYNHTFNDFSLSATAGSSFTKTKTSHVDLWGEGSQFSQPGSGNIFYPNIFTPNNYYGNMSTVGKDDNWMTQKRLNSVFATAQLGYREGIFLDISARNDWSSALAFTESCSFFYPSFGGSVLLNKFVDMGKNIDLFKFRASYSIVGNDVPVFMSNLELVDDLPNGLTLTDFGGAKVILKEGGHYGDLYVRHLMRDENGKPLQNEKGEPIVSGDSMDELEYAGNMNAKVNMGWTNTFRYKDFSLSFLIDAKFGGKVISMTEAALDGWGVSKRSGEARDAGGITVDGVKFDADKYYRTTGNNNFNSPYAVENYVYDATNIRLREVTFGYTFRNLLGAGKNLTAAIIGRNLFFFHKDAPMDPDVSAGTGNGIQGVDMFALPTSRSFGLNLKLNF